MIVKHSVLYLLARGIPAVINLLALAIFTRLLTPGEYGRYALIFAGIVLANAFFFQWWRLGLLRYLPLWQDRREVFLSTVMAGYMALAAMASLTGLAYLLYAGITDISRLILLGLVLLLFEGWYELNLELVRSQLSPLRYGFISILRSSLALLIGGYLCWAGFGAEGLLWGILASSWIVLLKPFSSEWRGISLRKVDRDLSREMIFYAWPFVATISLTFIVDSSDRFLLGIYLGKEAVGPYAVSYDLSQRSIGVLMIIINLAAYPLLTNTLQNQGLKECREKLRQNLLLLLAISVPATVGISVLASSIAGIFLGEAYRQSAAILIPWIALGIFLGGLKSYYADLAFQLSRRTPRQIWTVLVAAGVNVALNLWLIPNYGAIGAAYSTVAAFAAALGMSILLGRSLFQLPVEVFESMKIILVSLLMGVALWPAFGKNLGVVDLIFHILWGTTIYLSLSIALNLCGVRNQLAKILSFGTLK